MIDKKKKKMIPLVEVASLSTDTDLLSSFGSYFSNPDPVVEEKSAGKGIKLYDEVARDAHAAAVLQTRYLAVVGKEWSITPASESGQDDDIAQFVESVLMECNFDQLRLELLQAILYGYYGAEIMWKVADNSIVIDRFLGKHPRRFCFTLEREARLITIDSMIEGIPIPDRKFLIFQCGDSDNPYGKGLGQILWWYVWFKKHGVKFWVMFMEKFGMPTPVGKYPVQQKDQKTLLMSALRSIQKETGITIPDTMSIEFLEAARQGDGSYAAACQYFDSAISKAVLGQTLTTEMGGTGSYAASQTHNEVRQDIVEADADLLDAYLNKTLIPWIVDYNFPGVTGYPRLVTQAGRKPDLAARSQIDKTLSVEIGLPIAKSYFYETYGIPEPGDDDELVEGRGQPLPGLNPMFAEKQASVQQQNLDGLHDSALKSYRPVSVGIESQIRKIAAKYDTLEGLRGAIYSEYSHMSADDLERLIFETLITSGAYGRSVAQTEIEGIERQVKEAKKARGNDASQATRRT
jgi:phage gp29-like protein